MKIFISVLISIFILSACGNGAKDSKLDLMSYGLPISIGAPEGSTVEVDDMGVWKDASIKSGDDYFVQVICSDATSLNVQKIVADKKEEAKNIPFFTKLIQEDEAGFIFEKQIDENTTDYDFVHIRIQGDKEYIYTTGLYGTFSEDAVRNMYKSVQ